MRLIFTTILMIVAHSASLMAEQIRVLSGEHSYFSRLVLQFPSVVEWTLNRSGNDYVFRVPNSGHQFSTDTVFDLIPKTRILSVNAQDEILRIAVSKGVYADAFELRPGRIVIDIKDGQAKKGSPFEQPVATPTQSSQSDVEGVDTAPLKNVSLGQTETALKHQISLDTSFDEVFSLVDGNPQNQPEDLFPLSHINLSATQKKLTEQIGRAMSQGLLETNMVIVPNADSYKESSETENDVSSLSHIKITSPIEPNYSQKPAPHTTTGVASCLEDDDVAITSWGTAAPDMSYIGHLRNKAVGEFDRPDSKGIQNLAQYYLFLTFGAEARAVIRHSHLENQAILLAMADIMEMGYTSVPSPFDRQFKCKSDVAFWSVMAKPNLNDWEDYEVSSILSTFSGLPRHIRRHLGPSLSERFFAIGDNASASAIQNAISRGSGDHGEAFALLDAKIKISNGETKEAYQILEHLIEQDGPEAANATISLIETKSKTKEPVPHRIINNASALSVEHHDSPLEQPLKNAKMLANIYSGDARETLREAVTQLSASSDKAETTRLISLALSEITQNATDLDFLKAVMPNVTEISDSPLSDAARLQTAERLSQLGFSKEALEMLASYSGNETTEANILFARGLMKLGDLNGALSYIADAASEKARELEAEILFQQNNPSLALEKLKDTEEISQKAAYALLSEDWLMLRTSNSPELSEFASLADQRPTVLEAPISNLSLTKTMIEDSQNTRKTVADILK